MATSETNVGVDEADTIKKLTEEIVADGDVFEAEDDAGSSTTSDQTDEVPDADGAGTTDQDVRDAEDGEEEEAVTAAAIEAEPKQNDATDRADRDTTSKSTLPPEMDRPEGSACALVTTEAKPRRSSLKKFFKLKKFSLKGRKEKPPTTRMQAMMQVRVDSLPQVFITKYLGMRECKGLYGVKYTREPVDEMVKAAQEGGEELPLLELRISKSGLRVREHKANKSINYNFETGLIPIEFLSYGVQDTRFTRVFTFIVVRELSSRTKTLECHAYLCDSSVSARKMALSIALAFNQCAANLKDKPNPFGVDLDSKGGKSVAEEESKDYEA